MKLVMKRRRRPRAQNAEKVFRGFVRTLAQLKSANRPASRNGQAARSGS